MLSWARVKKLFLLLGQRLLVEIVGENRLDAGIADVLDEHGPLTSCFQSFLPELLAQNILCSCSQHKFIPPSLDAYDASLYIN